MRIYRSLFLLRILTAWTLTGLLLQLFTPITLYASNGGGPSTPEVSSFQAAGTGNMVDLATGDFSYNIPLMDIEGYPINLSYSSGITMDQEASMVGLGWNLNIGAVTRTMRGLPDDFKGDKVGQSYNMRPNQTWGISFSPDVEVFGSELLKGGLKLGIFRNNYKGFGFDLGVAPALTMERFSKTTQTSSQGAADADTTESPLPLGLNLGFNSQSGLSLSPSYSFSILKEKNDALTKEPNSAFEPTYSTRAGLTTLSIKGGYESYGNKMKNGSRNFSDNGRQYISFAKPTYIPQQKFPFINSGATFKGKFGSEVFGIFANASFEGYYSEQRLFRRHSNVSAYGYLHAEETASENQALLDFNREKDRPFIKNATPYLPLSQMTYDIFSVSGQGVGGTYRAFRSELGTVYDNEVINPGATATVEIEPGGGNLVHVKMGQNASITSSRTGKWDLHNELSSVARFKSREDVGSEAYEPFYFKQVGEKTVNDQAYYDKLGNEEALLPSLEGGVNPKAVNVFEDNEGNLISEANYHREKRAKRNQTFSFLNATQASEYALDTKIQNYSLNQGLQSDGSLPTNSEQLRLDGIRKGHHISEITINKTDGSRYVYGLPAYNRTQKEVSFNTADETTQAEQLTTSYTADEDNSIDNNKGRDRYYNATSLPPYSYAHHLTALLFPDYVDVEGDGITEDDLGNWVKFNYSQTHTDYKWRTPHAKDRASHAPGLKSDLQDEKGSYVYGEKEIWVPHSIESRNFIAQFTYEDRKDALEVVDENGGKSIDENRRLKKLMKIELYSKRELKEFQGNALPIKVVEFDYDYRLCTYIPNGVDNHQGKLTLKSLSFSYADSKKGKETPYTFTYNEGSLNPQFDLNHYDRWATYKPNDWGNINNSDFPYTDQAPKNSSNPDDRHVDDYAQSWLLKEIATPAGGKIKVSYESDDYAYVQDKTALQMIKLRGFNYQASLDGISDELYTKVPAPFPDNVLSPSFSLRNYLLFDLPYPVNTAEELKEYYFGDMEFLFFKFLVNLDNEGAWEYVPGYVEFEDVGVLDDDDQKVAWVKLKNVGIRDNGKGERVNPISKAAWNFTRLNRPGIIYPGSDPQGTGQSALMSIVGLSMDLKALYKGVNRMMRNRDFAQTADANKSWIRLQAADGRKHGGGVRVSKIELSDNWENMGGNNAQGATYGQTYSYTKQEEGREISSGVAAYEPLIGGDENPFQQPEFFQKEHLLVPDDKYYMVRPFGESLFPAPTVVYSEVKVQDLAPPGSSEPETGYTLHEFYTARDYPTITEQTRMDERAQIPKFIPRFFGLKLRDHLTVSQGYVIKLNDMHGKAKASWVYAKGQNKPISGSEFFYRSKSVYEEGRKNELNNEGVQVIEPDGTVTTATVGKEIDMVLDSREHNVETLAYGVSGNLDNFFVGILNLSIPSALLKTLYSQNRFRSLVATKVVNTYGIMDRVVVHDQSSKVSTENLAYDAETGEILLTGTSNEFKDPIYNFSYPAHWVYEGMGPAYQNQGISWMDKKFEDIYVDELLQPGDELLLKDGNTYTKGWVLFESPTGGTIISNTGVALSNTTEYDEIRILRSGHRNQQSLPIGSLTSMKNPLDDGLGEFAEVIDAGAVEYSEEWNMFCSEDCVEPEDIINPYLKGIRGVWYPKKNYVHQVDRDYSPGTSRENGKYTFFSPFWLPLSSSWTANLTNWTWAEEVNLYSPFGYSLESVDALGRKSASLYSYANQLPIATSVNAGYNEILNMNFEAPELDAACQESHFTIWTTNLNYSQEESHSGLYSLKLGTVPGQSSIIGRAYMRDQDPPCSNIGNSSLNPNSGNSVQVGVAAQAVSGYQVVPCDCIEGYSPVLGDTILMSFWVKGAGSSEPLRIRPPEEMDPQITDPLAPAIAIGILNDSWVLTDLVPIDFGESIVIDGWQRVMLAYETTGDQESITPFIANHTGIDIYIDDLRLQPFRSGMKTYVYHPYTLRLMAEGDDENYMTFYEYDEEGALIRVKKETERGIMTLQTNRNYTQQPQP